MPIPTFSLRYPSEIIFGTNALNEIVPRLKPFKTIMIYASESATESYAFSRLIKQLQASKLNYYLAIGIAPEAPLSEVRRFIKYAREVNAEAIVGIGGGTIIDAAKVVAAIAPSKQTLNSLFSGKQALKQKGLFFMAIPTTAGAGSELTQNSVLLDTKNEVKRSIRSPFMLADVAVVDPDFTLSCPDSVTVFSGLDALTQAIESYLSKKANPISQEQALDAIRLMMANVIPATLHCSDPLYRSPLALGSLLSGMAFSQTGLGAVHAFAHPIGARYDIPHGLICAALLRDVLDLNYDAIEKKLEQIALACGLGPSAKCFLTTLNDLFEKLQVPNLKALGITVNDIDYIVANCRSNSMLTNPRELTEEQIKAFFQKILK